MGNYFSRAGTTRTKSSPRGTESEEPKPEKAMDKVKGLDPEEVRIQTMCYDDYELEVTQYLESLTEKSSKSQLLYKKAIQETKSDSESFIALHVHTGDIQKYSSHLIKLFQYKRTFSKLHQTQFVTLRILDLARLTNRIIRQEHQFVSELKLRMRYLNCVPEDRLEADDRGIPDDSIDVTDADRALSDLIQTEETHKCLVKDMVSVLTIFIDFKCDYMMEESCDIFEEIQGDNKD